MAAKKIKTKNTGVYYYPIMDGKKESDRTYWISYRTKEIKDGVEVWKLKWEKIGKKTEGYSEKYGVKVRNERVQVKRHGETVKHTKITLNDLFYNNYLKSLEKKGSKKGDEYKGMWDREYKETIGKLDVNKIVVSNLHKIRADMDTRVQGNTASVYIAILRQVIKYGYRSGLHTNDLIFDSSLLACDKNYRERYLNKEEIKRLLDHLNDNHYQL